MANKRVKTMIQTEIQRLKELGRSQRQCSKILGISRNSVRKYWDMASAGPLSEFPPWARRLDWKDIKEEVNSGICKSVLHLELSEKHDDIPTYSSFCRFYSAHIDDKDEPKVTMKIHREPGHSVEVDYSRDGLEILNPATGEIEKVELFVGAMSYSSYFYAEFTRTQKQEDFIRAQENMIRYFGGTPQFIVPDNCKTAVISNDGYDPEINRAYHDFCKHYKMSIDPARVRRPQDKPVVERTVGIIQQTFLASIRKKTYTSLYQLNQDLRKFIDDYRHKEMKHRGHSRAELFEKEKDKLQELPRESFELFEYRKAKVHPDCHIQLKGNYYSVPYQYVGKNLEVKFNERMLCCYFEGEVVASHAILKGSGHCSTVEVHYPSNKIVEVNIHLAHARKRAKLISENVLFVIERLIRANRHPLKNLRKIQGILSLESKYSGEALDYGCEMALEHDRLIKRFIDNCSKNYRPPKEKIVSQAPIRNKELICLQGGKK